MSSESEKPVAWRSKDASGRWYFMEEEKSARSVRAVFGEDAVEPLYTASQLASLQREALERAAKVARELFYADWPLSKPDDWEKRKPNDHARVRYLMLANIALRSLIGGTHEA